MNSIGIYIGIGNTKLNISSSDAILTEDNKDIISEDCKDLTKE